MTRLLRVDESKVDALFNLAAELIVAKNSIAHLATQAEIAPQDLVRMLRRAHESIDRVAGDMHSAILQLRMVPIAQVFRSFPRLVRDMSQFNKKVELVTTGEATECDKTIADRLSEPLLHLLRNAVDHGIEIPTPVVPPASPRRRPSPCRRRGLVIAWWSRSATTAAASIRRLCGARPVRAIDAIDELNAMPDEKSSTLSSRPVFRPRPKIRKSPDAASAWMSCEPRSNRSGAACSSPVASAPARRCGSICP